MRTLMGRETPSFEAKQPHDTSQLQGLQLLHLNIKKYPVDQLHMYSVQTTHIYSISIVRWR